MLPKISVITAVLNCEKYIERAIKSVLSQNYPNLEYIVIDGGSTDGTLDTIEKYRDKIAYFVSEKDNGNCDAQNKGVRASTADFICYLAGDDWYEEGILIKAGELIQKYPDTQTITFGARSVILGNAGDFETIAIYQGNNLDLTLKSVLCSPLTNSRLFSRKLFDQFGFPNPVNYRGQYFLVNDREFMIRLALGNVKNRSIDDIGVTFFGHEDSMTFSKNEERAFKMFQEYLDIYEDYLKNKPLTFIQRSLFRTYHRKESIRSVWRDIRNGKYQRAWETAKRGVALNHIVWIIRFIFNPLQLQIREFGRKLRKV